MANVKLQIVYKYKCLLQCTCSMVPFDRTTCICDFCLCFQTYASEGRFTFTSHSAGEHEICLHSNSSAWFASGQLV